MQFLNSFLASIILSSSACTKSHSSNPPAGALPVVTIANITQARPQVNTNLKFHVVLDHISNQPVAFNYITVNGTGISNIDYLPVSGILTIPNGQLEGYIDVTIIGDSLRQSDRQFIIELSSPSNCTIGTLKATGTIDCSNGYYVPSDNSGYSSPSSYPGMSMVWSDEFGGNTINQSYWNFETGGNGWGNQELENYTARPQNALVSNGNLVIEARMENYGGNNYTSARLTTKNKKQFQFGRIDIRAKLPVDKGLWPALWMLGSNISTVTWPTCGEIDIMELIGTNPSKVYSTLHYANATSQHAQAGGNYLLNNDNFSTKFHVFSCLWVQDSLKFYVDDNLFFTALRNNIGSTYPFNAPFFFIFNVAVGGQWPGSPDASTSFPQRMFVDYIRVFQ